jgi:hypothetical protein
MLMSELEVRGPEEHDKPLNEGIIPALDEADSWGVSIARII